MATSKSTTAKKPAAKKTTASTGKASAKIATAKRPATAANKPAAIRPQTAEKERSQPTGSPRKTAAPAPAPTAEQRYKMIQDAAYFMAEKSGFLGGTIDYWMAAEIEIDAALASKRTK